MKMMQKKSQESTVHIYPWISGGAIRGSAVQRTQSMCRRGYRQGNERWDHSWKTAGRRTLPSSCHTKVNQKVKPKWEECEENQRTKSIGQVTSILLNDIMPFKTTVIYVMLIFCYFQFWKWPCESPRLKEKFSWNPLFSIIQPVPKYSCTPAWGLSPHRAP